MNMSNENENKTGLAVRENQAVATAQPFSLEQANAQADFEKSLKQLSVSEFVSPTSLLPNDKPLAKSARFDMLDCFDFELTENGESKTIVIYVCDFGKDGVKTVAQSLAGSREKYITAFNNARINGKNLRLTNLEFVRLDKGKKAGNFPIVIQFTGESKPIITDK